MELNKIYQGQSLDLLKTFPDNFVDCCITSPPYWGLRDYGIDGQLGLEKTPEEYTAKMVSLFAEVKRVLKDDGVMFLNLGDSYASSGELYGNADRPKRGFLRRDFPSQNQCGGHKDYFLKSNLDIPCPVHGQVDVSFLKNQEHTSIQNDHLPIDDSLDHKSHTFLTNQDFEHLKSLSYGQANAFLVSRQKIFSQQCQAKNHQLDNSLACQDEDYEKILDAYLSSDKRVCICDIVKRLGALDRHRLGIVFSDLAYQYFTITPHKVKPKDLVGIPWRVAFALQADGWYLRQDIIWHKPNPMPESVTDRCTSSHEYIFLLTKSPKYFYDYKAIREPWTSGRKDMARLGKPRSGAAYLSQNVIADNTNKQNTVEKATYKGFNERFKQNPPVEMMRNKRSVWTVTTKPFKGAHFATFPEDLILPCILAGCPQGGVVLDPFMGAGTTALVAKKNGCNYIGCELNQEYINMAEKRISQEYLFVRDSARNA